MDFKLEEMQEIPFRSAQDGISYDELNWQEAAEFDLWALQLEIGAYNDRISDYISKHGEYDLMTDGQKIIYQGLENKYQELLSKYQLSIRQYRKNKIEMYDIWSRNIFPQGISELPDIAAIVVEGHVRFNEHAIQNGKERLKAYSYFPYVQQVELAERDVITSPYGQELFTLLVDEALELAERRRLCTVAYETVKNAQQPKSILNQPVQVEMCNAALGASAESMPDEMVAADNQDDFFNENLTIQIPHLKRGDKKSDFE